jgi:hypothetical protein
MNRLSTLMGQRKEIREARTNPNEEHANCYKRQQKFADLASATHPSHMMNLVGLTIFINGFGVGKLAGS